jgi:hypothetical protein
MSGNLHARAALLPETEPQYALHRRLGDLREAVDVVKRNVCLLSLPGTEFQCLAQSLYRMNSRGYCPVA